jgi:hypothetical protein
MPSSGMIRHVALVRIDISEERSISTTILYIVFCHSVRQLLVTANVPSSLILVTIMMEVIRSSETSVLTRATQCNIPEDSALHSYRCENLKSYLTKRTSVKVMRNEKCAQDRRN